MNVVFQNDTTSPVFNLSAYVPGPTFQTPCTTETDLGQMINYLQAILPKDNGGIIDARGCHFSLLFASTPTITVNNLTILLPCQTINATAPFVVPEGIRNTTIKGCSYEGGSADTGTQGGTTWNLISGTNAFEISDINTSIDTVGFSMADMQINTSAISGATYPLTFYQTQEINLQNLLLSGPNLASGAAISMYGGSNYSGGNFANLKIQGYGSGIVGIGGSAGGANASTFTKMHIVCSTSGGSPIAGTVGIDLSAADGNTFLGGDVEKCDTMLHLQALATDNSFFGVRNEQNNTQIVADAGSQYNLWAGAGTLFTGRVTDNGTRNSFVDTFHLAENGFNGDWYGSQIDATITDHQRLGIGLGNERGRLSEIQTDYGYRWESGYSDGTTGLQNWSITDMINSVPRLIVQQYLSPTANVVTNVVVNNGGCYSSNSTVPSVTFTGGGGTGAAGTATFYATPSWSTCVHGYGIASVTITAGGSGYTSQPTIAFGTTNQVSAPTAVAEIATAGGTYDYTAVNAAGTGAVILNGSANAGNGGILFDSGGATPAEVAAIDNLGNLTTFGNYGFYTSGAYQWHWNCASTSVCALHNDAATTPANVFRAFPNAGTEIDSQGTSPVTVNNTSTAGTGGLSVYEGGANYSTEAGHINGTGQLYAAGNSQIGSASGIGSLAIGNHLNQLATADYAGTCAMSSSTTCHVGFQHSYGAAVCLAADQSNPPATYALGARYASGDCYVTAAASNSDTWGCVCVGNPD